jgi:predicted nucleic-acid-binding protein
MLGLDTNVLVRLLIEDDPTQTRRARNLVDAAVAEQEAMLVSLPVLLKTEWVLRSRYELPPESILSLFRAALEARELTFEDEPAVEEALFNWQDGRSGVGRAQ